VIGQLAAAVRSALEFRESMERLRAAAARAADGIAMLRRTLLRLQVISSAPRNFDRADSSWQTDLCAAWLHGDCPFPAACDCVCHGGGRR
jgi:hypothetical protein